MIDKNNSSTLSQPQPGSFFHWPEEAEKREPGNEVAQTAVAFFLHLTRYETQEKSTYNLIKMFSVSIIAGCTFLTYKYIDQDLSNKNFTWPPVEPLSPLAPGGPTNAYNKNVKDIYNLYTSDFL